MSEQLFIALLLLSVAKRSELRDHAFGDREVFWDLDPVAAEDFSREEGSVAGGYFGSGSASLWMVHSTLSWSGEVARDLAKLGGLGVIERNDSTGPDSYAEGVTMPALTLEGVAEELGFEYEDHCSPDSDGVCYHPITGETHIVELVKNEDMAGADFVKVDKRGQDAGFVSQEFEAMLDDEASYWETKVVREEDIL